MQQPRDVINEIQKGLEGLEMLAQWQLSLASDLVFPDARPDASGSELLHRLISLCHTITNSLPRQGENHFAAATRPVRAVRACPADKRFSRLVLVDCDRSE
jgi:hypothetical protein